MTCGCLIEDPPPYTQPEQTPPRLDLRKAAPLIDELIVTTVGGLVPFNVPVASEDAGDELSALLLLDYDGDDPNDPNDRSFSIGDSTIAPGTLADLDREISFDATVPAFVSPGCHRLTLLVTHDENLSNTRLAEVFDWSDVALAVWWVNVDPTADGVNTLVDCPLATGGEQ